MRRRLIAAVVTVLLGLPAFSALAEEAEQKPDDEERSTSFAVVPGPFYNPNIGLGVNVIPMMMFYPDKDDKVSPPSMVMLNLLYAIKPPFDESNHSVFFSAASRLFLDEDRWRSAVRAFLEEAP